jgi:hypothetical protein
VPFHRADPGWRPLDAWSWPRTASGSRRLVGCGTLFMLKVKVDSMTGAAIADDAAILGKAVAVVRPAGSAREASATRHSRMAAVNTLTAPVDPGDEPRVQDRIPGQHRVGAADGYGRGIHSCGVDIAGRVVRIRARTGASTRRLSRRSGPARPEPTSALVGSPGGCGRCAGVLVVGKADRSYMTDPKPSPASRTSSIPVAWSRCTATGTAAEPAMVAQARASGPQLRRGPPHVGAGRRGQVDADPVDVGT